MLATSSTSIRASRFVSPETGAITLPRAVSASCCAVAPGRSSSESVSVNSDEKVPVRAVAIDTAYGRDDPDRRFANGASVVENTPAGAGDDTPSRSSLAVHAVPDVAGRLKTANASLPPAPPRINVPKSIVSDVVVAAEANEPTAWSRTVVETVPLNVGFMAWRLDAVTLTVPLRRPASVVLRVRRCMVPAPMAASLPVPLDAKPPVPAKAYWSRSAPAATATGAEFETVSVPDTVAPRVTRAGGAARLAIIFAGSW